MKQQVCICFPGDCGHTLSLPCRALPLIQHSQNVARGSVNGAQMTGVDLPNVTLVSSSRPVEKHSCVVLKTQEAGAELSVSACQQRTVSLNHHPPVHSVFIVVSF
jgi:hypothetical protein